MGNRVKERLAQGKIVTGTLTVSPSAEAIQTIAAAGFDYVVVDQMYGGISWRDAAEMSRAARLAGISPIMRLQAEPWAVVDNKQVAVDAGRALSLGYEGLMFSVTSVSEVEAVVTTVDRAWHRELHVIPWTREEFGAHLESLRKDTFIGLLVEGRHGYESAAELAAVKGIDSLFVATTDLSIEFTGTVNSESSETWDAVDHLADLCKTNDLALWANTGMGYATFPEMVERAKRLVDHGAQMILFQTSELLLQMAGKHLLSEFDHQMVTDAATSTEARA
jgi:4-hydroxy-2-oxoheptanedioate aldolase